MKKLVITRAFSLMLALLLMFPVTIRLLPEAEALGKIAVGDRVYYYGHSSGTGYYNTSGGGTPWGDRLSDGWYAVSYLSSGAKYPYNINGGTGWTNAVRKPEVIFRDYDGKELKKQAVSDRTHASAPGNPSRTGYTFTGWLPSNFASQTYTNDQIVTAQYTIKTYTVTFADWNGSVLRTQSVNHGAAAAAPANPSRTGYTFTGWSRALTNITANTTITAQYRINTYVVTFLGRNGVGTLKTETVNYGAAATAPTPPSVTGWTFLKWSASFNNITTALTVTAEYTQNEYLVIFQDWNNETLSWQILAYGGNATAPSRNPMRSGYTFTGWDRPASAWQNITAPVTITATYSINVYNVTFEDWNGALLSTQSVNHGSAASAPPSPSRNGYSFTNWSDDFTNIMAPLTVIAAYEEETYTVTFFDGVDETTAAILDTQYVAYGEGVDKPPEEPTLPGYRFKGWIEDFSYITANTNIHADWSVEISATANIVFSHRLEHSNSGYSLTSGNMPDGVLVRKFIHDFQGVYGVVEYWEIYGILSRPSEYNFTITNNDNGQTTDVVIVIRESTNDNVINFSDEVLDDITNTTIGGNYQQSYRTNKDAYLHSQNEHIYFMALYIDSEKQRDATDFEYGPGSTRITIYADTVQRIGKGTHTFCAEFRLPGGQTILSTSAVQINVQDVPRTDNGGGGGGGGGGGASVNASILESAAVFDRNNSSDINLTLRSGDYSLNNLTNNAYTLIKDADYIVDNGNITIKESYLSALEVGEYAIVFEMSGGIFPAITLTVKDTTPQPVITALDPLIIEVEAAVVIENGEATAEISLDEITDALEQAFAGEEDQPENRPILFDLLLTGLELDTTDISISIPSDVINTIAETANASLRINAGILGTITLNNRSLNALASTGGDLYVIALSFNDNAASVNISVDGVLLTKIDGGIRVAFQDQAIGDVVLFIPADGEEKIIKKSIIEDGKVYALIDGSGTITVINNYKGFIDISPTDWFFNEIRFVSSRELFLGVNENEFAPGFQMTRSMVATVLHRLEDYEDYEEHDIDLILEDMPSGYWYSSSFAWALEAGIISGYGDGKYGINDCITREQLAVMMFNFANYLSLNTIERGDMAQFEDAWRTSSWANEAMRWAVGVGITKGDGVNLNPKGYATRAEVSTMIMRLIRILIPV